MATKKEQATENKATDKALAVLDGYSVAKYEPAQLMALISENMGGEPLSMGLLTKIKIPAGGGLAFERPTLTGEPEVVTAIEGVIVAWKDIRAYWPTAYDGGNEPPACASEDGRYGICIDENEHLGGDCMSCPLSKFGTKIDSKTGSAGKGKACREARVLFVLTGKGLLPIVIVAPPTSIKSVKNYFMALLNEQIPYWGVISKIQLIKAKNTGGIEYSQLKLAMVKPIPDEEIARVKSYVDSMGPILKATRVEVSSTDVDEE